MSQQQHAGLTVAFVIDTSASMGEKAEDGRSLLDHAKDVVEQLTVKSRHTPAHHVLLTTCLLLTTEEWPGNVKTSWADWGDKPEKRMARFQEQLRNLQPSGQNASAPALGKAFELLGQHRLGSGVDTWGKGRSPWRTEPGAVILITDGKNVTAASSAAAGAADAGLGMGGMPRPGAPTPLDMDAIAQGARGAVGAELCGKPFRWDQRLFSVILGSRGGGGGGADGAGAGGFVGGIGGASEATVEALRSVSEETGGCLATWDAEDGPKHKTLASHVSDLLGNVHKKGPVVMFRSEDSLSGGGFDDDDDFDAGLGYNAGAITKGPPAARAVLTLRSGNSFWPIPEPFWVDRMTEPLPARQEAQPELVFRKTSNSRSMSMSMSMVENTPPREALEKLGVGVDQYELDWCGAGSRLDIPRSETWPLVVKETTQSPSADHEKPFGYLRASQTTGRPLMMVLPYNYDTLIPLLTARAQTLQQSQNPAPPTASSAWAREFMAYIKGVPTYYLPALQRVLQPFLVQALIPGEGLQSGGGVLHRKVTEKLNSLKELAVRQVERNDRIERAGRAQDAEQRQQQQQDGAQSAGSSSSSKSAYSNAFQVPVGELLSQWEIMRTQLFGTGGATVGGLFSAGPAGQRRVCPPSPPPPISTSKVDGVGTAVSRRGFGRKAKDRDGGRARLAAGGEAGGRAVLRSPVLGCVAESLAPARSTHEMSNFMAKMRGVEFPRDPMREPGPDEHMRQRGGFQRLMAATTFESPFAKKKNKTAGIDSYNPLELDEAANESAILEMEDKDEEAKEKDAASKSKKTDDAGASDKTGTSPPPGTAAATGRAGEGEQKAGAAAASSSSASDPPAATATAAAAAGADADGGKAEGGWPSPSSDAAEDGPAAASLKRMSSMSHKMLPKLVASRGRRKMGKDKHLPASAAARRGDAAGIATNGGGMGAAAPTQQRPPDSPPPPSSSTVSTGLHATRTQDNERRELVPPMSPALAAPRTPDYSPPSSPAYPSGQPASEEGEGEEKEEEEEEGEEGDKRSSKSEQKERAPKQVALGEAPPSRLSTASSDVSAREAAAVIPTAAAAVAAPVAAPAPTALGNPPGAEVPGDAERGSGAGGEAANGSSAVFENATALLISGDGNGAPSAAVAAAVAAAAAAGAAAAPVVATPVTKPAQEEAAAVTIAAAAGGREREVAAATRPPAAPKPRQPAHTPTPPRPRPPPPRPPPPKPSSAAGAVTTPAAAANATATATTATSAATPVTSGSLATKAHQPPPKPRPPPPKRQQAPPSSSSAPAAVPPAATATAASTATPTATATASPHASPIFTPTTSPAKFTPTTSPATFFTPTVSPATFTPTASPATRAPGSVAAVAGVTFTPTSSPASRGGQGAPQLSASFTKGPSPSNGGGGGAAAGGERGVRLGSSGVPGRSLAGGSENKHLRPLAGGPGGLGGSGSSSRAAHTNGVAGGASAAAGSGGVRDHGEDARPRKRPREEQQQEQQKVLTPHDYVLPEGWIVAHSRREKRDYFFNQRTNTTQWHPPEGSRPR
eukprot:g6529.t1